MKRIPALILALLLLLPCVGLANGAWNCPDCGQVNESNYCGNCGRKRPETGTASSQERAKALNAYVDHIQYMEKISKGNVKPSHFWLFDMNGDGIEEMIVYGVTDYDFRAFVIFGYQRDEVWWIGDSYDTCDFSEWSNCDASLEIRDGQALYATIGKATVAIDVSLCYRIDYDGFECIAREGVGTITHERTVLLTECGVENGIPFASARSYIDSLLGGTASEGEPDTDVFEGWRTFKRAMQQTGFFTYEDYVNTFCDAYGEPVKMGWSKLVRKVLDSGMTGGVCVAWDLEPEQYEYYGAIGGEKLEMLSVLDVLEACYEGSFYDLPESALHDIWPDFAFAPAFDYTGSEGYFFLFNDSAAADKGYEKWIRQLRENDDFSPDLTRDEGDFRFAAGWYGKRDFQCVFKIDNAVICFEIDDPTSYFYQYLTEGICTFYGVGDEGVWACD